MAEEKTRAQLLREVAALRQRIAQLEAGDHARQQVENPALQDQKITIPRAFPGDIINEFNNVLTVILGYTELALSDVPPTSTAWGFLQHVHTASKRARDLVHLLFLSTQKAGPERNPG